MVNRRVIGNHEKHVTSHDGLSIFYEVSGKGKTLLVFVHGLGGDVAAWDEERVYFDRLGYKTIAIDLRAHGFSDHPKKREGFAIEHFARDIQAVIDEEKPEAFVLVGHCFGGMVVYTYEVLFPGNAKAMVLVDSSYRAPYLSQTSLLKRFLHHFIPFIARLSPGMHIPRHVDYTKKGFERDFEPFGIVGVLKHNSLKTFLSVTDVIFSMNVLDTLQSVKIPTLIISGTKDSIYPPKMSKELHKRISNSTLVSIEGANHPVVLNNPMEVSNAIARFLKRELA